MARQGNVPRLDFQENVFLKVVEIHLSGAGGAGARKMYFLDCYKDMTCSWNSKKENVVKHHAYLDILLMVSLCAITYLFVKENPKI